MQDNVLNIINQIMDVCIPQDRAPRDFCVKFPEEIRHDNLAGQLWFGAEVVGSHLGPGSQGGALCSSPVCTCGG